MNEQKTDTLAIISLVCGIIGFLFGVFGIVAIITGIISLNRIKKNHELKGKGIAIAGLVLGIITLVLFVIAIAFAGFVINMGNKYLEEFEPVEKNTDLCNYVEIKIQTIGGSPQICQGGNGADGYIEFTLANQGKVPIEALRLDAVGGTNIMTIDSIQDSRIDSAGLIKKRVPYDLTTYSDILLVLIEPKVKTTEGVIRRCPAKSIRLEQIRTCP